MDRTKADTDRQIPLDLAWDKELVGRPLPGTTRRSLLKGGIAAAATAPLSDASV